MIPLVRFRVTHVLDVLGSKNNYSRYIVMPSSHVEFCAERWYSTDDEGRVMFFVAGVPVYVSQPDATIEVITDEDTK